MNHRRVPDVWWPWLLGVTLLLLLAYLGYRINRFANEQMAWMDDLFSNKVTHDDDDAD